MNNTRLPAAGGIKARVLIPIYISLKTVPYYGFAALYPTPDQRSRRYPNRDSRCRMSSEYTFLPFGNLRTSLLIFLLGGIGYENYIRSYVYDTSINGSSIYKRCSPLFHQK